jgi:hypothetical protein
MIIMTEKLSVQEEIPSCMGYDGNSNTLSALSVAKIPTKSKK